MQSLLKCQRHFSQKWNKFKFSIETQKTLNTQNDLEKQQSWRTHTPRLQTIWQSYRNQNSMELAQKLTRRSIGQNGEPRNNHTHLWPTNLQQRRNKYTMEKESPQQDWDNWRASCKWKKLEHSLIPHTKINPKSIKTLNVRPETITLLHENVGRTLFDINHSTNFNPIP